jgi:hypothetical protein
VTEEKFCPICKNKNPSDAETCHYCGASFSDRLPPITTVPVRKSQPDLALKPSTHLQQLARLPADALVLFIMDEEQPLVIRQTEKVVLGRNISSNPPVTYDLTPYGAGDLGVSRHHALIELNNGACTITDLGSTNGTWLNDSRLIPQKPYPVHSGEQVRLGNMSMYVYFRSSTQPEAAVEEIILLAEEPRTGALLHPRITASYLGNVITPFLQALADVQGVIDQSHGYVPREVVVNTISALRQDMPIGISLSGASDAVRLLTTLILPWRKEHALVLTGVYSTSRPATSPVSGATTVITALQPTPTGQLNPNAVRVAREANLNAAVQKVIADRQSELTELALQFLAEAAPFLGETDKQKYAAKILPPLALLAISRLQVTRSEKQRDEQDMDSRVTG